jgi:UDP-N-acetylmuramyl pentapeptide synthase
MLAYRMYQKEAFLDGDNLQLSLSLQSGRWSVFAGIEKSIIIDSSYNASPRSMHSIIQETLER